MLDFNLSEMAVVALVALVVIGPKDLPKAMRVVGHWVGRARGVARQFRFNFDEMVREAELAEMEKKWAAENERIMREHPMPPVDADHGSGAGDGYTQAAGHEAHDVAAEREADADIAPPPAAPMPVAGGEADDGGPPPSLTPRP